MPPRKQRKGKGYVPESHKPMATRAHLEQMHTDIKQTKGGLLVRFWLGDDDSWWFWREVPGSEWFEEVGRAEP